MSARATTSVECTLEGVGLHTGSPARVALCVREGPVRLRAGKIEAGVDELVLASTVRATTVEAHGGALRVSTVEHVFSALAGLGIYSDVMIVVDGPELPLLDGGAAAWCEAIATLCVAPRKPFLRVMREWVVDVGPSRYELTPGDCVEVEARIVIEDARVAAEAHWAGDASDYRARIAPARTFAVAANLEELARRGLARQVDPTSVVVLAPDAIHHSGRPFSSDEPARHKLLDLIGDLYLHGGPPIGRVRAVRPGHSANAQFIRRAIHAGAITRLRP